MTRQWVEHEGNEARFCKSASQHPESEWQKLEALHALGASSGRFQAPRPLSYDPIRGVLAQQLVPGARTFGEALGASLAEAERATALCALAGEVLGILHEGLDASGPRRVPVALSALEPSGWAGLHWDYSFGNLLLDEHDRLWVVDPTPRWDEGIPSTAVGPIDLDLGIWLMNLYGRLVPRRAMPLLRPALQDRLATAFLVGYRRVRGGSFTDSAARRAALACLGWYRARLIRLGPRVWPRRYLTWLALRRLRSLGDP